MSNWNSQMHWSPASQRRRDRDAIKQSREVERREKERAKLDAIDQAKLEVESFQNQIDALISIHKECSEPWDWSGCAAALPPPTPVKNSRYELRARQTFAVLPPTEQHGSEEKLEIARLQDEQTFLIAQADYSEKYREWEVLTTLARKIRVGDRIGYGQAITEISQLGEITHFGPATEFIVHTPRLLECVLSLSSTKTIPTEGKTLTAGNKVSIKPIPTARFHEIYQDYVCSCMLRVARELFALLPIETLLLTTGTVILDSRTGHTGEQPVLSVVLTRDGLATINFGQVDPSDAIDSFRHRGDFKASRKTGGFAPITPLTLSDVMPVSPESLGLSELLKQADHWRTELATALYTITGRTTPSPS